MRLLKTHPILGLVNSYLVDSPQPSNLSYAWNGGSLLGLCLITQLATGIFLAMHYIASADLAFISVESIMRDVNSGWMIRYIHANTASLFFAIIYLHIARGMWYGSYGSPRTLTWSIGVIILILLIVTAFLGYVLVYGQMSLWGYMISLIFNYDIKGLAICLSVPVIKVNRISAYKRIGPHNKDILSIIFGSMLGGAHGEKRAVSTRFTFQQEHSHVSYGLWLHNLISKLGYGSSTIPDITTRLNGARVRKLIRFRTYTYASLNWIHEVFYTQDSKGRNIKRVPDCILTYLTPLALAIWIMDDGAKVSSGLKFCTNSFTYEDCLKLSNILFKLYGLKTSVHSAGAPKHVETQYNLYVWKQSMPLLRDVVKDHMHPSMLYKIL